MTALLIETSTERGLVALFQRSEVIASCQLPLGFQSSRFLMPALADLLQQAKITPQLLDYIALGVGPGSYTGMRVGAIVAKTLAYSCRLPLVGVPSLWGFVPEETNVPFIALIDAKIGGVYFSTGEWKEEALHMSAPAVCSLEEAKELLRGKAFYVSPALVPLKTRLAPVLEGIAPQGEWIECFPRPEMLARFAEQKWLTGDCRCDYAMDLLYLRKTQAEIEKEEKNHLSR